MAPDIIFGKCYLGLPERKGTLKADLTKFDAGFFGIFPGQAERVDPQIRQLLEVTFEAILDAGVNPNTIRGSNIGVFVGASAHDTFEACRKTPDLASGYDITGSSCCMLANRISFAYDLRGPSYCIDTFCSSSLMALHQGLSSIRNGECDAALVSGVNLIMNPITALQIQRLGGLSADGKCKSFDASADGFVRAEGIVTVFLQRADVALRSYGTLIHSKTNTDGFKVRGVSYPAGPIQQILMEETYREAGVNPADVFYVEPHGTGTAAGDPQEVNAMATAFTKGREKALWIGSTKSNMGHAEPAAALCSLAKILLSLRAGVIPANLHFKNPNPDIPALSEGRIKVVVENTPISGNIFGINSTGLGGSNIHVIVQGNERTKTKEVAAKIPILVPFSGRTKESLTHAFEKVKENKSSGEFISLLHKIGEDTIPQHSFKGYTILDENLSEPIVDIVQVQSMETSPPLWFIFSGMGTLWCGMMEGLMEFGVFAQSIHKSNEIAARLGINLYEIMMNGNQEELDQNMGTCFIAMGIALIELLTSIDLKPQGFIGHSAGELLCAYMDGCISQEEALICYYYKDIAVLACSGGGMAAVGLTWEEAKSRCPPGIYPACHNAVNNVTVSGPQEQIQEFIQLLKSEGIFAREVSTGGIAYHSPYLEGILPDLAAKVSAVAKSTKPRSNRWISTSILEDEWEMEGSIKTGSADYVMNNIKSPVLFQGALKYIPTDAVVLEVSAHALFVSMLKKALPDTCPVIGLLRKGKGSNGVQFLTAIGKLFQFGFCPKISALYEQVSFPVPANTPMIAPLVKWDHSVCYSLPDYISNGNSGESTVKIALSNECDEFLSGHVIDGRNVFPATGYLLLVWKKFATICGLSWKKLAIEFEGVRFERAALIPTTGELKFDICLDSKTGEFEVSEGESSLVTGIIRTACQKSTKGSIAAELTEESKFLPLIQGDVYKELRLQGYEYQGLFKGIKTGDNEGKWARIAWANNWVAFLDNMMQFSVVKKTSRGLYIPTRIQRVCIDPIAFEGMLENNPTLKSEGLFVTYSNRPESIKCHGVEIMGLKTSRTQRKPPNQDPPILEEMHFIPYRNIESSSSLSLDNLVKYFADLVMENFVQQIRLQIQERVDNLSNTLAKPLLKSIQSQPLREAEITVVVPDEADFENEENRKSLEQIGIQIMSKAKLSKLPPSKYNLIILHSTSDFDVDLINSLEGGGFVLLQEQNLSDEFQGMTLISLQKSSDNTSFALYRKISNSESNANEILIQSSVDMTWFPKVQEAMKSSASDQNYPQTYLISKNNDEFDTSGLIGFTNCLRRESGGHKFSCILSKLPQIPPAIYTQIQRQGMTMNVINEQGVLGSYRHFPVDQESLRTTKSAVNAFANVENVADLSSLKFIESPPISSTTIPDDKILCQVSYSALNFRDVMLATGRLPQDSLPGKLATDECVLGLEFSGHDPNQNRIMGMVEGRGMAGEVIAEKKFTWKIPRDWSLEEAATVPVAYSTAYYALIVRGRLRCGESVLIHSGSGGVGQAAIAIALSMQCNVYITVGSLEKKKFLMDRFPQLQDTSFANSRDTSFENRVMYQTDGKGVDLILNSLSEEKLQASLRCLAEGGRFLEIGKFDLSKNNPLGMGIFLKNVTFHGILLDSLFGKNSEEKEQVVRLVEDGIQTGVVTPLKAILFDNDQIESAFRFMASGKHIGKVLLRIREEGSLLGGGMTMTSRVRTYFDPEKSYIIVGGLGGFGLELAGWMIGREAKKIILVSRSGVKNGYQSLQIRRWMEAGVQVKVSRADVTSLDGAQGLIKMAEEEMGPVGGIFNLAMVLKDGEIQEKTIEDFQEVLKPKIQATKCLDAISRKECPLLTHFVVFSSAAAGRGNIGQTNYGFTNSGMERICEKRKADNLPAMAIQWAAIGDVGIVQEILGSSEVALGGTLPQRLRSCLDVLDLYLRNEDKLPAVVSSMVLPVAVVGTTERPSLISSVARILGFKNESLPGSGNRDASLAELGVDSLTVVELKQLLDRSCHRKTSFSTGEIRELTWAKLEEMDGK